MQSMQKCSNMANKKVALTKIKQRFEEEEEKHSKMQRLEKCLNLANNEGCTDRHYKH